MEIPRIGRISSMASGCMNSSGIGVSISSRIEGVMWPAAISRNATTVGFVILNFNQSISAVSNASSSFGRNQYHFKYVVYVAETIFDRNSGHEFPTPRMPIVGTFLIKTHQFSAELHLYTRILLICSINIAWLAWFRSPSPVKIASSLSTASDKSSFMMT